eukprot:gb/GEZN01011717.1/.p1 GENE.gb/GEZN01011717.1/~~gb/GEZN01011717.1/.p1  ORF type:complete len:297 (-),score=47.12 gb/GEZN01011717.1/:183-1073(-)
MPSNFGVTQELDHWPQDDMRAFKELGSALLASVLVSPLVTIIDKSIVKEIEGLGSLARAMAQATVKMIFQPKSFFGGAPFLFTTAVYAGTYTTANFAEMGLDVNRVRDPVTRKSTKVALASVANVSLLAWRDVQFAKMFMDGKKPVVPKISMGLFMVRDTATMMATFYGAPTAAKYLIKQQKWDKTNAEVTCALAIPVATQILTAPIHTFAFDMVARPDNLGPVERMTKVFEQFPKVSFARSLRILPAFGIGSYTNNKMREHFIEENLASHPEKFEEIRKARLAKAAAIAAGTYVE